MQLITKNRLVSIISFVAYLIPFAILTGPFLADLLISFISLIFLFIVIKSKDWKYFTNNFFILFLAFYSFLILRSIFSENMLFSLEKSIFYFRFGIFSLTMWFLICNNSKFIFKFSVFLFATFCLALIDGYFQYFNGYNLLGLDPAGARMSLLFSDNAILGGYIARIFPFILAFIPAFWLSCLKYFADVTTIISPIILLHIA